MSSPDAGGGSLPDLLVSLSEVAELGSPPRSALTDLCLREKTADLADFTERSGLAAYVLVSVLALWNAASSRSSAAVGGGVTVATAAEPGILSLAVRVLVVVSDLGVRHHAQSQGGDRPPTATHVREPYIMVSTQ